MASSATAVAYNLDIDNQSSLPITVVESGQSQVTIHPHSQATHQTNWGTIVQLNYKVGDNYPQGLATIQRDPNFNAMHNMYRGQCARGLAKLKTTLNNGIDAGDHFSTVSHGNCSLDSGDTCKISETGKHPNVSITIEGGPC